MLEKIVPFTDSDLIEELEDVSEIRTFNDDEIIFDVGQRITHMPIVLQGGIKVYRQDEDHELLLYVVESGDTCAIGLKCCLDDALSKVRAVAEGDVKLIMVPVKMLHGLSVRYPEWYRFIIGSLGNRIDRLFENVEDLAFSGLDQRLLKYLKEKSERMGLTEIPITHQELALDLNSSREVITRVVRKLENEGKIKSSRGKITLM